MSPDVMAAFVTGIFGLLAAVAMVALPKVLAQARDIAEVKDQVKNSHGTNLRDDLDSLRKEVRHGFSEVHARLNNLEKK